MSGISGVVHFDGRPAERKTLEAMAAAASHRGPDGIRHHASGPAGLSHLALDVTPEDARERQPLADGGLALAADARVDNREELLRSLRLPKSSTDAEVVLASYGRWGAESAAHLVGDFAFCVWDGGRGRLYAARDAMGMRSLYYRSEGGRFLFGTEAKQILAAPGVPRRIFEPALGAHLAGPYGLPEWSFYEGISQLAPAHALVADADGVRVWRYWEPDADLRIEYSSEEEYAEHFLEVFTESVRARMRSAKPVGLFLSGGMDSGSVASVAGRMARLGGSPAPSFRAYSWAFEELADSDERHISEGIARHYGFRAVDVPADDMWPLKGYPDHGPDADSPLIWVYEPLHERTLSMARSDGVGIMMSGDRGDEMVGDWVFDHPGLLRARRFMTLYEELRAHGRMNGVSTRAAFVNYLLKPALDEMWPDGMGFAKRVRRSFGGSRIPAAYPDWVRPEFARRIDLEGIIAESEPRTTMSGHARRIRYGRIFSYAIARLLSVNERTWSRFGLSFADPFSDRRLAEFVLAVPQWRVQSARRPKRVARLAMRGVMPEESLRTAGKIIPESLFDRGFKDRARDTVLDLTTNSEAAARGYLDEKAFHAHYDAFLRGEPTIDFWWPVNLEMWLRHHWS